MAKQVTSIIDLPTLPHAPGVYFDLPEEEYHEDPSLSQSGIKDLLISPLRFWWNSNLNPDRADDDASHMVEGSAWGCRILEGKNRFDELYAVQPDPSDFPNALIGNEALKKKCQELGVSKSGTALEMSYRIVEESPETPCWPIVMARFQSESNGKTILKPEIGAEIEARAKIIESDKNARGAFRGGFPEVSIFWVDKSTKIPMKARVDYMKPMFFTELKSFTNTNEMALDRCVAHVVANRRYHIQAFWYHMAVESAKKLPMQGPSDRSPNDVWLKSWRAQETRIVFAFVEKRVPNIIFREFPRLNQDRKEALHWTSASQQIQFAIERYLRYWAKFGAKPWMDIDKLRPLDESEFPPWMHD